VNEVTAALGIPPDAEVITGSDPSREGWESDWIGVRLYEPPPRPWPWPYRVISTRRGPWLTVQVWSLTLRRPGFLYTVRWHPQLGRTYLANGSDPGTLPKLIRDAQRAYQRETRGRKRHQPRPEHYMQVFDRLTHAAGVPPSRARMADEFGVLPGTVSRWLRRSSWRQVMADKYRVP
jgi:hypothetical protein